MTIDVSGLLNLKMEEFLYDDGWFIEFFFTKQFLLKAEKTMDMRKQQNTDFFRHSSGLVLFVVVEISLQCGL